MALRVGPGYQISFSSNLQKVIGSPHQVVNPLNAVRQKVVRLHLNYQPQSVDDNCFLLKSEQIRPSTIIDGHTERVLAIIPITEIYHSNQLLDIPIANAAKMELDAFHHLVKIELELFKMDSLFNPIFSSTSVEFSVIASLYK